MIIVPTSVRGAFVVDPEPIVDERGLFARSHCEQELEAEGLQGHFVQSSISYNERAATLRGLHFRLDVPEVKLVRCTRGRIFDVVVDLDHSEGVRWFGVELSDANRRALYVPAGMAHGFVTLENKSEVLYQISEPYVAGMEHGVRWNDSAIAIAWPCEPIVMSARDSSFPDWLPPTVTVG